MTQPMSVPDRPSLIDLATSDELTAQRHLCITRLYPAQRHAVL